MPRSVATILLLIASNTFMTLAWYGHLRFKEFPLLKSAGLFGIILISWAISFFEYLLMVPANRLGSGLFGGPFNIWQLKIIQEVVSVLVFVIFALVFFKTDELRLNHLIGFALMIGAVYFFFRK
jgi:uncharacterized protein (DUF486 family)